MTVTRLTTDIREFEGAVHIADVHIRLTKRHDEYSSVFSQLYNNIEKTPINTCIVVAGDIFHSKSDLSPECIQLAVDFLRKLATLRPTVLIAGNHDATLSNKNRLDSLSPIVSTLNHPNLHYLKDSGLYILGDILFNHMSVFDPIESYIKANDIPKVYRHDTKHLIGLFHGAVDKAVTDIGYEVSNKSVSVQLFDGHDIVMLGDIHKFQVLPTNDTGPIIVYPGSILQQNHGESLIDHGYVAWNLKCRTFKHFSLINDYGFFTIDIKYGKLVTDVSNIPKKARLRIRCFESVPAEVKGVVAELRKSVEISEITHVRITDDSTSTLSINPLNLSQLTSVDYQNSLIKSFILKKSSGVIIPDSTFDKIFEINNVHNALFDSDKLTPNIRWKPKKFEFSNMFSYGENNVIDFSKMKNVVGLFAANATGKTSILSALCFCIFDKCDRAFKASHVLNSQKSTFHCKFNFEIDKIDYFIERCGKSDKKGVVKVDVKFWKDINGKIVELQGEARRSTNDLIRDHLGSYEDFVLTVMSIQNNRLGTFVDMSQSERKDLLSQFMGLTLFDSLFSTASDKLKELMLKIKLHESNNTHESLMDMKCTLELYKTNYNRLLEECENLTINRDALSTELLTETTRLIKLENDVPNNITTLTLNKSTLEKSKIDNKKNRSVQVSELVNITDQLDRLLIKLNGISKKEIDDDIDKLKSLRNRLKKLDDELNAQKTIVAAKFDKIHRLKSHEYDPQCKYCTNNEFVKDALSAKDSLSVDKLLVAKLLSDRVLLCNQLGELGDVESKLTNYESLINEMRKFTNLKLSLENKILTIDGELSLTETNLSKISNSIELYNKREFDIKNNIMIESKRLDLITNIKAKETAIKIKNLEIRDVHSKILSLTSTIENVRESLNRIDVLQTEITAYEHYVSAVSRDGIPLDLISQAAPIIEKDVNHILSQVVEFGVGIQIDGKNVTTNICYADNTWPLELASGFEKFLTSLCIRVALLNISNLPRPNFITIDEGFGCADATYLPTMSLLFSILKVQFEFMLIISHLDSMRDMVDEHIIINKDGGFSKIIY